MSEGKILLADKDPDYGRALAKAVTNSQNGFSVTFISLERRHQSPESRGKTKIDGRVAFQDYDLILLGGYPAETAEAISRDLSGGSRIVILTEYMVESLVKQSEKEANHLW